MTKAVCLDDAWLPQQRVAAFFATNSYPGIRRLTVRGQGGTVRLEGTVGSFHEKQLATTLASRVPGVFHVIDRVAVRDLRRLEHCSTG